MHNDIADKESLLAAMRRKYASMSAACQHCGRSYIQKANTQKYCDAECKAAAKRDQDRIRGRKDRKPGLARNDAGYRVGEDHGRAKLSNEQVAKMRRMYRPGIVGYETLAQEFNCGASTVRDIVNGWTRAGA